jgi:uncharacterized repeat protein (TIGR03803 family)
MRGQLFCVTPMRSVALLVAVYLTGSVAMFAQAEKVLHRFEAKSDGDNPLAGLVTDSAGNLYGTASDNSTGGGTIFEMSPPASSGPWTFTTLYTLTGNDGSLPWAPLLRDSAGNLYGTATSAGAANCGTVFELSPPSVSGDPWIFNLLYSFAGGTDGCYSAAPVIMDSAGNLYGTTENGGKCTGGSGCGVGIVFELSPPAVAGGAWTETVLYRFGSSRRDDGAVSAAGLTLDAHGNLYGTTFYGGKNGVGTIFGLQPPSVAGGSWTEHLLYSFDLVAGGGYPGSSLTFDGHGNMYGTTADGPENAGCDITYCGGVYELSPPAVAGDPWTYNVLWAFTGGSDGSSPYDPVIFDKAGNLYGTTAFGGVGGGTVFELSPPSTAGGAWTDTTLYQFTFGLGGTRSWGAVVFGKDGWLYGTTFTDGIKRCSTSFGDGGCGTVFALKP